MAQTKKQGIPKYNTSNYKKQIDTFGPEHLLQGSFRFEAHSTGSIPLQNDHAPDPHFLLSCSYRHLHKDDLEPLGIQQENLETNQWNYGRNSQQFAAHLQNVKSADENGNCLSIKQLN